MHVIFTCIFSSKTLYINLKLIDFFLEVYKLTDNSDINVNDNLNIESNIKQSTLSIEV